MYECIVSRRSRVATIKTLSKEWRIGLLLLNYSELTDTGHFISTPNVVATVTVAHALCG